MHAPVSKKDKARRPVVRLVSYHQEFDRDEHQNGRPLAYQGVAFEKTGRALWTSNDGSISPFPLRAHVAHIRRQGFNAASATR
jgi:hypothetical protein